MSKSITVNLVGDISLFKEYENRNIDPFKGVELPQSDFNIGNFEFIIPNNREKFFYDVQSEYSISYEFFKSLNLNLFNAFSLSNNHCMDYGLSGVNDVTEVLENYGVTRFGFGRNSYNHFSATINGISIAIISFVKKGRWTRQVDKEGPDGYNTDKISEHIIRLKENVDHVIVFPHWGTELVDLPDPIDVLNARSFIDSGASAVIGHHPHIIQGMELYKGNPIYYSLGSFIYIPENELGYNCKQSKNRNYSICLSLKLSQNKVESVIPYFYKYNENSLLPERIPQNEINDYFAELSNNIGDSVSYRSKVRRLLLKRELQSLFIRLKKNPVKTIVHYANYIEVSHFKKLLK